MTRNTREELFTQEAGFGEYTLIDPEGSDIEEMTIEAGDGDDDVEVAGQTYDFGEQARVQFFQIDYTGLGAQFTQLTDEKLEVFFNAFNERAFSENFLYLVDSNYLLSDLGEEVRERIYELTGVPPTTMELASLSSIHAELDRMCQRALRFSSTNGMANRNARIFSARLQAIKANLTEERWANLVA